MKPSLHAQAAAVDAAARQANRRNIPAMKPKEWEHLEPKLMAACETLMFLDANRHRLPAELLAEINGAR